MPAGEPFVFFVTDMLITGDLMTVGFDFTKPAASMKREGTWPEEELYRPSDPGSSTSVYEEVGLEVGSRLDRWQPDEEGGGCRYFNAGGIYGADPKAFGERFLECALAVRDDRPDALVIQSLDPWLDQVVLPLVIHSFGGGRPAPALDGLDGDVTCHYRLLPLLYARESDHAVEVMEDVAAPNKIKKWLKQYDAFKRMIYQGRGQKVRAMFDRSDLPPREKQIRNRVKSADFWVH